ncbi:MAG: homoserine kinase [Nitrospirota bacterium]|nr:homoserine kinase [Nitrospirota bacterium]
MKKSVTIFAPASVGNLGPGFDVLGMALSGMGDTLRAEIRKEPGIVIKKITGDKGQLPSDPTENTASIAAQAVLTHLNVKNGISLSLHKEIPGTGLGSSAASAVAGAYAANLLFDAPLSKLELIPLAAVAEEKVSGGFFLDNVGPSFLGGVTWNNPFSKEVVRLGAIENAVIVIVTPNFRVLTKDSREVLPESVPMADFIANMSQTSMISWAVSQKDLKRFGESIQDHIIEPARAPLIKGFDDVKNAALSTGALGCSISGAGSAIFAVAEDKIQGEKIALAMKTAFAGHGIDSEIRITTMDLEGAREIQPQ